MSVRRRIDPVAGPGQLAESPLWDGPAGRLLWVDILGGTLHALDPSTGRDTAVPIDQPPAAVALVESDQPRYLLAEGLELNVIDWPLTQRAPITRLTAGERANDGAVDPIGRYVVGTMAPAGEPGGAELYQVDRGRTRSLVSAVSISNGLDWSLDGSLMYYVDTPLERIEVFDYDVSTGAVSGRRTLVELAEVPGRPDGLTVDAEGGVWVAMARGGSALRRFTRDGRPDLVIELPVPNVTSLAFGGDRLDQLYVTTSRRGLSEAELARWPLSGTVLRVDDPGVAGRHPNRYRP